MSYMYHSWIAKCNTIIAREATRKYEDERRAATAAILYEYVRIQKTKSYRRKRHWVHPILQLRRLHGFYEAIFPTLSYYPEKFENYFRMSASLFEELLGLVASSITKKHAVREPIAAEARLAITLRYLATGDCISSVSYQYLVGHSTVCSIVKETCEAIWLCFSKLMLPHPLQRDDWLKVARDFENQWQFNHCIGAIDGKHVLIQCPENAGSSFYNYKNSHSIVLLAICDANYSFTHVDIGAFGRRSDGGIFKDSAMGQKFNEGSMNIPEDERLTVDGVPLPYVLVGDEAFQLTSYLLRPYQGRGGINQEQSIFNYRLSRARRVVENAFGILVSQWRIFKKPMEVKVDNAVAIVKALICLHNWLRKRNRECNYVTPNIVDNYGPSGLIPGTWRHDIVGSAFRDFHSQENNRSTRIAAAIRDEFCDFFSREGAVGWQYNRE